jgi:hypothetical protein
MLRQLVAVAAVLAASPVFAGETLTGEEARHFVAGKLFNYTCFEGTKGAGRVFADGSVVGTIQIRGDGPVRRAFLPAGTLKVSENGKVCASLKGLPIEPCFNLTRTDANSFRGAISGLGFAYCDFVHGRPRATVAERVQHQRPIALRPSLAETE